MKSILLLINILFLVEQSVLSQSSTNLLRDWKSTQVELARGFEDNPDNPFSESEAFKKLKATGESQIFLEMAAQTEYPMVALAGFLCLKEERSKQAVVTAMHILLETGNPASPINGPIIKFLGKQRDTDEMRKALSEMAAVGQYHLTNFQILLLEIPYNTLFDWYQTQPRRPLCATSEAAVLDRLAGQAKEHGKAVTSEMNSALNKLQLVPGFPRFVFVLYANASESVLRTNLNLILEDENISGQTLTVLVLNKRKLVEGVLSSDQAVPEQTRGRIERLLKRKVPAK